MPTIIIRLLVRVHTWSTFCSVFSVVVIRWVRYGMWALDGKLDHLGMDNLPAKVLSGTDYAIEMRLFYESLLYAHRAF